MRHMPIRRFVTVFAACTAAVVGGAFGAATSGGRSPAPVSPGPAAQAVPVPAAVPGTSQVPPVVRGHVAPERTDPPITTAPASVPAVPGAPTAPTLSTPAAPPVPADITVGAFIVADASNGAVLAERAPHQQLRPASTLKVLTALALMPRLDPAAVHVAVPDDIATLATAEPGASAVGVKPGLAYRVSDLWNGVFLRSGNDAIATLAHIAGGVPTTLDLMRQTAKALHATDTVVVNADGYDADGQVSSAYDLALMARAGLADPGFRSYCSMLKAQFPGVNGKTYELDSENHLLGKYPGMIGVKNGYTSLAHHTFVGAAERNGRTLIVTMVNAGPDIYQQTAKLLDWGFATPSAASSVDQLIASDPLPQSTIPNRQLPLAAVPAPAAPPAPAAAGTNSAAAAQSANGQAQTATGQQPAPPAGQTDRAALTAAAHKHGSSVLGDVTKTLACLFGLIALAVAALRARVVLKRRKIVEEPTSIDA